MRLLAEECGLSVATVSRALRGSPLVTARTRKLVEAAAHHLGYEFNPYVGQLMSSFRRSQGETMQGNLAFIWCDVWMGREDSQFGVMRGHALRRAAELGYSVSEFTLLDHTPTAMVRMLSSRGIRGVLILSPAGSAGKSHLRLNLEDFACVSIGWSLYSPAFHRVRFDHFQATRLAIHHAKRRFGGRIAVLVDFRYDQRSDRSCRAAFLSHHPDGPAAAAGLIFDVAGLDVKKLRRAYEDGKFAGLIVLSRSGLPPGFFDWFPHENMVYLDDDGDTPSFGRVDLRYDLLGRWSVDHLVGTIQRHETGEPAVPMTIFVPPRWMAGNR
ncbi:DNA-binding transcriptional regulator, LacI/PurR family [Terrimicrobium sacchariphilum]|uniref:DNA-binding transcriptional regulator, LacI/PurR family n=2 Tax=Terrimicrobium sacchariphilum TaxID=690879 RepID=A0A146GBL9_TERSA|nr:DNA-binding transcriptional regulator, LacI/PurR family [Terrimicrobium sacchariphilum]